MQYHRRRLEPNERKGSWFCSGRANRTCSGALLTTEIMSESKAKKNLQKPVPIYKTGSQNEIETGTGFFQ